MKHGKMGDPWWRSLLNRMNAPVAQWRLGLSLRTTMIVTGVLGLSAWAAHGIPSLTDPPNGNGPVRLGAWSFNNPISWTNDAGYIPRSVSNVVAGAGNGIAAMIDGGGTNAAWLQFNVNEADGTTNLTTGAGTLSMWFAPNWSSVDQGDNGPGCWGRLIEAGTWTTNAMFGWWSLYFDPAGQNIYFSGQANGSNVTYLSAPISWVASEFHSLELTYSPTNSALYIDGDPAATGTGVSCVLNAGALANGFFIGSDGSGLMQARGTFDDMATFDRPIDNESLSASFVLNSLFYADRMAAQFAQAPASPSTNTPNVVTGSGYLQQAGTLTGWLSSSNVWMTNVSYSASANGTFVFGIAGGVAGSAYDLFATSLLMSSNGVWTWMGQGYPGYVYAVPNLASTTAFFVLGTPLDSDGDGLTDAYERLVSRTSPYNVDTDGDGIPDGWSVLLGLNAAGNVSAQPGSRLNYGYDSADWFRSVSGARTGSVTLDAEGNVTSVSQ